MALTSAYPTYSSERFVFFIKDLDLKHLTRLLPRIKPQNQTRKKLVNHDSILFSSHLIYFHFSK